MLVLNEQELLDGVRRFDPLALSEAHDRYYPKIFRFITYKIGNRETAEDLTSEVFVRLLEAAHECNSPDKSLLGWLYCVATHIVNDFYRRKYRGKQEVALLESIEGGGVDPVEEALRHQDFGYLHNALDELTDEQRQIIDLRFGGDLPIKEVAKLTGKSEGAVKQLQARALIHLTRIMNERN